jgi:uncharacterized protein YbjT (DUF2867 family)
LPTSTGTATNSSSGTPDLAGNLVAAVDAEGVDGERIDIGWDRPVSMNKIAEIAGHLTARPSRYETSQPA